MWKEEKTTHATTSARTIHFQSFAESPRLNWPPLPPEPPPPKPPRPLRSSSSSAEGPRGFCPRRWSAGSGVTHGLRGPGRLPSPPLPFPPSSPSLGPLPHGLLAIWLICWVRCRNPPGRRPAMLASLSLLILLL